MSIQKAWIWILLTFKWASMATGTLWWEITPYMIRVWLQFTANLDGSCPDQCMINHLTVLFPPTWLFLVNAIQCLGSKMTNWLGAWRNSGSQSVRIIPEDQSIHPDKQRPEIHLVATKRLNNHGIVTNWEKLTVITASQVERGARFSKELWQNCSNKSRPESLKGFMIKNQAVQLTAAEFINHHTMQRSEKLAKQLKCKQFTTGQWKHLKKNCFWMTA